MNVFPSEVCIKILSYLNYPQLLIVKNVNKDFSRLVNYVVGSKTVWIQSSDDRAPVHKMFSTNEYVYADKCFLLRSLVGYQRTELHNGIRQLILPSPNLLPDLTGFNSLIHLELISNSVHKLDRNFVLNANNLEVICIQLNGRLFGIPLVTQVPDIIEFSFQVNCPKLWSLKTDIDLNYFDFLFPKSIIQLHCPENTKPINDMMNLIELVCVQFDYKNNIFFDLVHLEYMSFIHGKYGLTGLQQASRLFDNLHKEHLTIFYRDININAGPLNVPPSQFYFEFVQTYTKYIDFIDTDSFPSLRSHGLGFPSLNGLPSELIQKMTSVRYMWVGNSIETKKWIEILKVTNLEELFIISSFSQNFYDQIPTYCSNLMELEIKNFDNLDFVLKLKYLHKLKCEQFFDFNLFDLMIRLLPHLVEIKINTKYKVVLNEERIECYLDDEVVLNEQRETFQTTLLYLLSWSELFSRNSSN